MCILKIACGIVLPLVAPLALSPFDKRWCSSQVAYLTGSWSGASHQTKQGASASGCAAKPHGRAQLGKSAAAQPLPSACGTQLVAAPAAVATMAATALGAVATGAAVELAARTP